MRYCSCTCTRRGDWESEKIGDKMFPVPRYQRNITRHHHATGNDVISLQNPSGTEAHCRQQAVTTSGLPSVGGSCTLPPQIARGLVMTSISTSVVKWTGRTRGSGPLRIYKVVETSLPPAKFTVLCAVSRQPLTVSVFVEGIMTHLWYLQKLQRENIAVIGGAGHVDIIFFTIE